MTCSGPAGGPAPGALRLPALPGARPPAGTPSRPLGFQPFRGTRDDAVHPAPRYRSQALIRRGDPTLPGANVLDTHGTSNAWLLRPGSATAQWRQFGYICDAIAFFPLERGRRGLLCASFPERLSPEDKSLI